MLSTKSTDSGRFRLIRGDCEELDEEIWWTGICSSLHPSLHPSLPGCLLACLAACLPACLPASLSPHPSLSAANLLLYCSWLHGIYYAIVVKICQKRL